jgi:predicted NBD/HSP70 family sugar kinase
MIHGNSGISSGLYLANSIYRGNGGLVGGLGHVKVVAKGRSCDCGGHGCLEAYVSKRPSARLFELGWDLQLVSCIADAASRGDRVVLKVLQEAGAHLGIALANLVYAVNLRHIVLGGDLAELADYLLPSIRKVLSANVALPSGDIQLHVSALGRDAVAFGGVALAMEGFLPVVAERHFALLPGSANAPPAFGQTETNRFRRRSTSN